MSGDGKPQFQSQLLIALIGFSGLVGSALINSWGKIFSAKSPPPAQIAASSPQTTTSLPSGAAQCDGTAQNLLEASQIGDLTQVISLLDCGSDPNLRTVWQQNVPDSFESLEITATPIHAATWNGHLNIVEELITAGADVNALDGGGYSSLMMAAEADDAEIVTLLLGAGADVNYAADCLTCEQETALILAAEAGHSYAVEQLLDAGADKQLSLQDGQRALDLAKKEDHTEVIELLQAE